MSNMAFGKVLNQEMSIMNISYIFAQINEIVETVLPLQKSSAALLDSLLRNTHTHTPYFCLYGHYTQGLECNVATFIVKAS